MAGNWPLVSILIPVYNRETLVSTALSSAVTQTYPNIEIVVGDNCSTDRTYEVVQEYARRDQRIRYFRNEENLGPLANWVRCLEYSRGDYIKILWSDDWLEPEAIERYIQPLLVRDDLGFCFSTVEVHWSDGRIYKLSFPQEGIISSREILLGIATGTYVALASPGASLFRRPLVEHGLHYPFVDRINLNCRALGIGHDLMITLIACQQYPYAYCITDRLAHYRGHSQCLSVLAGSSTARCWYSALAHFVANEEFEPQFKKQVNMLILLTAPGKGSLRARLDTYARLFPDHYDPFRFSPSRELFINLACKCIRVLRRVTTHLIQHLPRGIIVSRGYK